MAYSVAFFQLTSLTHRNQSPSSKQLVSSEPVQPLVKKIDKEKRERIIRWLKFMPTMALIGVGSVFIPHFALGCAISAGIFVIEMIIRLLIGMFVTSAKMKKEYVWNVQNNPEWTTLFSPILEELIFRGFMLQFLILLIGLLFPPVMILNTGFSMATGISILITAVAFGLAHASNAEEGYNYSQMVAAGLSGLVYGFLAIEFGLLIPIAAHIFNNTMVYLLLNLLSFLIKKIDSSSAPVVRPNKKQSTCQSLTAGSNDPAELVAPSVNLREVGEEVDENEGLSLRVA